MVKMEQWAISSEASLETKMNVQRLLKLPNVSILHSIQKDGIMMGTKEGVNRNVRRRRYGARDKEEFLL